MLDASEVPLVLSSRMHRVEVAVGCLPELR